MADIIQFKRGLSTAWTSINPVLADTEIGVETDTGKEKQGDAVTAWNDLPYKDEVTLAAAKTYADSQDVTTLQSAKDYADGLNDPTVDHTYLTVPAMISLQNEQLMDDLIKVTDAGADSRITGKAYYFYNGTIAGTLEDYHLLSNSELATLTGQAVIDALGYTPEPLNVPPIADTKVKVFNSDDSYTYEDYGVGTTYAPFTNTVDGLVPAPNVSGTTTYTGAITSPAQGFTITEGVLVTVTASESSTTGTGARKKLTNEGWLDDNYREEKYIDGTATPIYELVAEDKHKFLSLRFSDLTINIPNNVFQNGDVIKGFCHTAYATFTSDMNYTPRPLGSTSKCIGYFEIRISSTGSTIATQNALTAILTGDFIHDKIFLKSPNGTGWEIEVSDAGAITTTDRGFNF